jgi:histidyl-tRNA synthetase
VAATGCSIGVSRLVAALAAAGRPAAAAAGPVVILALDADAAGGYLAMASELRAAGIAAEVYLGGSGMRAQMKYADKRAAPVAIIEGEDERARGVVTLKDLALGAELSKSVASNEEWRAARPAQQEVARGELVAAVKAMLAR